MFKKILCFSLCAIMLCGCFLIGASADEPALRKFYNVFANSNVAWTGSLPNGNIEFEIPYGAGSFAFDISNGADGPYYTVSNNLYEPNKSYKLTIVFESWIPDPDTPSIEYYNNYFVLRDHANQVLLDYYSTYEDGIVIGGSLASGFEDEWGDAYPFEYVGITFDSAYEQPALDLYEFLLPRYGSNNVTYTNSITPEYEGTLGAIKLMFTNFGIAIGGLAEGIKESTTNLLWKDPSANNRQLSDVAIFIFTIAGLAIGMTVFFLVFRLIRFGRQR